MERIKELDTYDAISKFVDMELKKLSDDTVQIKNELADKLSNNYFLRSSQGIILAQKLIDRLERNLVIFTEKIDAADIVIKELRKQEYVPDEYKTEVVEEPRTHPAVDKVISKPKPNSTERGIRARRHNVVRNKWGPLPNDEFEKMITERIAYFAGRTDWMSVRRYILYLANMLKQDTAIKLEDKKSKLEIIRAQWMKHKEKLPALLKPEIINGIELPAMFIDNFLEIKLPEKDYKEFNNYNKNKLRTPIEENKEELNECL